MKYTVQGKVTIEGGEPEMPLYVYVEVANQVVDGFSVAENGEFEQEVNAPSAPDAIQFLAFDNSDHGVILNDSHRAPLDSMGWQQVNGTLSQRLEADIPWELVDRWGDRVLKEFSLLGFLEPYRLEGRVVTKTANGQTLAVPNARVEIIEYDPRRERWSWAVPPSPWMPGIAWRGAAERRDTLGVVWADVAGKFDFSFTFSPWNFPTFPPAPTDAAPDIIIRISQQIDGRSVQLLETKPLMSLEKGRDLGDLEVPIEKVLILPNPGLHSNVKGFQAIGLLPVDESRIQDGYASSQAGDLISCKNAPFGGVLELYGLIDNPEVTHYRLSYAAAGTMDFEEVSDSLRNYVFDSSKKVWKGVSLGPVQAGGVENLYRSIENESGYLYGEKLKARWATQDLKPGKYTLRLEGFRHSGSGQAQVVSSVVHTVELRIDNARPHAEILGVYKQGDTDPQSECGIIDLRADPKQQLRVKVRVRDPEGHLGQWRLSTGYGRNRFAGPEFVRDEDYRSLQSQQILWVGPGETDVVLPVGTSGQWLRCAYSFHLYAVGRSTNGRSSHLRSQETHFHLNTYIDA